MVALEIEDAVRVLLQGLGEDHAREGLRRTPHRVAEAFRQGTRGYRQRAKDVVQNALFPEAGLDTRTGYAGGTGGLVVVRDINLFSYCESCLLPFRVLCHIGYIPSGQKVVGLSKLARVSEVFAKRLQEPQRLANEICSALENSIKPAGVAVVLQCWHIQFPQSILCNLNQGRPSKLDMEGWIITTVSSKSGLFKDGKISFWDDFSSLLKIRGIDVDRVNTKGHLWCPSNSFEVPLCNGHSHSSLNGTAAGKLEANISGMIAAVRSIIHSLGEDPLRKELVGTPYRYVQWLMNFKSTIVDIKLNGHNLGKVNFHKTPDSVEISNQHSSIHSELHLPFCSQCEHHLLPFYGVVHVGYFGNQDNRDVERDTLQSMIHFYACKLQVQERLTRQIVEAVYSSHSGGVMVVVEANHICMMSRGIEKFGSSTATIAVTGQFSTDQAAKAMFLDIISKSTAPKG